VWEDPVETGGTGGGVSAFYSMPSWQQGPGVNNTQYNPNTMRSIPDVSADADPASGAAIYVSTPSGSEWTQGGGTSQSTPIWAGIAALINQYLQQKGLHRVGFLNPALYHIADSNVSYRAFHDITVGTNLYYPATPGYDIASGLGTPDVWNLALDLEAYQRGGGT
jgi:kumamolisin